MNTSFTFSALIASFIGGFVCIAGAWTLTLWKAHRSRKRHESWTRELQARESLYAEFVNACAKLLRDFMEDELVEAGTLASVIAAMNRIRLTATTPVLKAAESTLQNITQNYLDDELLTLDEKTTHLRECALKGKDPVAEFSRACRDELWELQPTFG